MLLLLLFLTRPSNSDKLPLSSHLAKCFRPLLKTPVRLSYVQLTVGRRFHYKKVYFHNIPLADKRFEYFRNPLPQRYTSTLTICFLNTNAISHKLIGSVRLRFSKKNGKLHILLARINLN